MHKSNEVELSKPQLACREMTDSDHSMNDHGKLEFIPIGFPKQNRLKRSTRSPIGTLAEDDDKDKGGEEPPKKLKRTDIEETMDSYRIFNDSSQFDDTLPQLDDRATENNKDKESEKKVRPLMGNIKENAPVSKPLKEQQEQLHKLNSDNYNLRLKCNSLLKFLYNVTDQGELTKNLGLLDEINEWKQKHYDLNQQYLELKTELETIMNLNASEKSQKTAVTESDHMSCKRDFSNMQNQLEKTTLQLRTYKDEVAHLEKKILKIQEDEKAKKEQQQLEIQLLKSDVNNLNVSIADKEGELESSRAKVQRLTNQLYEFDHKGSQSLLDFEKQMETKRDSILNLEKEVRALTHNRIQLELQIKDKETENSRIKSELEKLRNNANDHKNSDREIAELKLSKTSLDERFQRLVEEKQKLDQRAYNLEKECGEWRIKYQQNKSSELEQQKELSFLRQELQMTKNQLEETRITTQQLQTQVIENATKNSERTSQRIKDKELQIQKLEAELLSYEQQLKDGSRKLHVEEQRYRETYESELQNMEMKNGFERTKLEKEIALLRDEKETFTKTHAREVELWKSKCDSLNKENDRLVREEIGGLDGTQRKLNQQIDKLQKKLASSEEERSDLAGKLIKLQHSKDNYRDELKRLGLKLEYLSKEYLKIKESSITDEEQRNKYSSMKQRLLDELKSLQDENLSLERKLLEQRGTSSRAQESSSLTNSSTQDRLDYYKLKYNTEVKHNNDLRIINDYLNRVLKAGSQHLKLDLLKLENEVIQPSLSVAMPSSRKYSTCFNNDRYRSRLNNGLIPPSPFLRFKAIAILVLACVRMKQTATRRRWDEHRMRYLRNKMVIDDDRISW